MQARVVAEKFNTLLIFAHRDEHASEARPEQCMQSEKDNQQDCAAKYVHAGRLERVIGLERNVERWNVRHAIEAAKQGFADMILRSGSRVDHVVENQRDR